MARDESIGNDAERLGLLLKRCRARIDRGRASLGSYSRLPMRVGKALSQQEVAEAVGITREWYAQMETDRTVHVSASVLAAIADVLMMDSAERTLLFKLAIPELRSAALSDRSTAVLDAFGSLRRFTRALWTTTTEAEALELAREYAFTQLVPDAVISSVRVGEHSWQFAATGKTDDDERVKEHDALVRERYGAAAIDDLLNYTLLTQPGELITRSERDERLPRLGAKDRPALEAVGRGNVSWAMTSIRSQRGVVARLMAVHVMGHAYSEIERAQLSTLADLTSLAVS